MKNKIKTKQKRGRRFANCRKEHSFYDLCPTTAYVLFINSFFFQFLSLCQDKLAAPHFVTQYKVKYNPS